MKTNARFPSALLFAALGVGCAPVPAQVDDDTAEATDEARATEQYFTVRRDTRRCAFPRCGGFVLARVGRTTTRCADGREQPTCYVPTLTVERLRGADLDRVIGAASAPTTSLVVRGRLETSRAVATQAWVAPSGAAEPRGTLRLVSTPECAPGARCGGRVARALSNGRTTALVGVDFGASPGTDAELEEAHHATETVTGLVTAGDLARVPDGTSLEVTQYLLPVHPTPARDLCGDALRAELTNATRGLLMPSESDYPFEYVSREGAGREALTVARFRSIFGVAASQPVEERSLDDQFARLTRTYPEMTAEERAQAARFQSLHAVLRANLQDVRVYRVGTIQIRVYIVGRTRCGAVAGLRATVIET